MKRYITEKAIDQVAYEFGTASKEMNKCSGVLYEYFLAKKVAIVDTFAYLTGQTFNHASYILEMRYRLKYENAKQ